MLKDTRTAEEKQAWEAMTREERHAHVAKKEAERKARLVAQKERFDAWMKEQETEHEAKRQAFKAELKALMEKYNASIGFNCDEGSDTEGLTGESLYISIDGNVNPVSKSHVSITAVDVSGWGLDKHDL